MTVYGFNQRITVSNTQLLLFPAVGKTFSIVAGTLYRRTGPGCAIQVISGAIRYVWAPTHGIPNAIDEISATLDPLQNTDVLQRDDVANALYAIRNGGSDAVVHISIEAVIWPLDQIL
jgi:hypothetical protein